MSPVPLESRPESPDDVTGRLRREAAGRSAGRPRQCRRHRILGATWTQAESALVRYDVITIFWKMINLTIGASPLSGFVARIRDKTLSYLPVLTTTA